MSGVRGRLPRSRDWLFLSIYTLRQFRSISLACRLDYQRRKSRLVNNLRSFERSGLERNELLLSMLVTCYYDFPLSVCQTRCC